MWYMRMAEEKVCTLKCNKRLFIITYKRGWVRGLIPFCWVSLWQLLKRKKPILVVCLLLWSKTALALVLGRVVGLSWQHLGFIPYLCHSLSLQALISRCPVALVGGLHMMGHHSFSLPCFTHLQAGDGTLPANPCQPPPPCKRNPETFITPIKLHPDQRYSE